MVIPAFALKALVGAVVCGSLATSIAVPVVMSKNSSSLTVLKNFPKREKDKFKDKCQLLTKDEDSGKREQDKGYLLVCEKSGDSSAEFYYYSFLEVPKKVTLLEKDGEPRGYEVKVKVKTEESDDRAFDLTSTNGDWTDLIGKSLSNCGITKGDREENRWTLKCPRGDSTDNTGILLTPVIIN